MRLHVVSLPHTQTTRDFSACAYTEKVRKFCNMMTARGHSVHLYAGEKNEAQCAELLTCISESDRKAAVGDAHYVNASFDYSLPYWRKFNAAVIGAMRLRVLPRDFICVIGGMAHKEIADAFPTIVTIEFGIGYSSHGTFARFKVWESYAWMHTCYGALAKNSNDVDGAYFDAVIPNYFEVADFPFSSEKDDYFLYMGRLIDRKGYNIAVEVCQFLNKRLIVAGAGDTPSYGEYVGVVDPERRGQLMSRARAVFAPTRYIEPFGGVAVEAMLCGTPVICTDWGAFTETVQQGVTGFRCRMFEEFVDAAKAVDGLDYAAIRDYAVARYSTDVVASQYEAYFNRLNTLWGKGWYETAADRVPLVAAE